MRIRATVTHDLAKRCGAFSIGGRVLEYELHNETTREFYALATRVELIEISITNSPANPFALVQRRYPASAQVEFSIALAQNLGRVATLVQEHAA